MDDQGQIELKTAHEAFVIKLADALYNVEPAARPGIYYAIARVAIAEIYAEIRQITPEQRAGTIGCLNPSDQVLCIAAFVDLLAASVLNPQVHS